jgi:predicted nucleotidyltransferase
MTAMSQPEKVPNFPPVRLSEREILAIRHVLDAELAGYAGARAWLFGSRTNMQAKGGDIDLFIEVEGDIQDELALARRLGAAFMKNLGERKIDIVLKGRNSLDSALHQIARNEGVPLWQSSIKPE